MRLFNKKYIPRSPRGSTSTAGTAAEAQAEAQAQDDEILRRNFGKLFAEEQSETYVQGPDCAIIGKGQSILQDASPVSIANEKYTPPSDAPLKRAEQEPLMSRAALLSLQRSTSGKQMTPRSAVSAGSIVTPSSQVASHSKPPKFVRKREITLESSPMSLLNSPISTAQNAHERHDDSFETAEDDDLFSVEEATRRDFGDMRHGLDLEEELIRTSATFRFQGSKDSAGVEMSAEEILRSQHLNSAKRPPKLSTRPPPLATRAPSLVRPPPLIPSDSPQSVASSVFGNDGDFSTGGFTITSAGMVTQPEFALREDSEVQTLSVADFSSGAVVMRDMKEFKRGPTIGAGAAGKVYLALHEPSSVAVAMKTVNVYDGPKRKQLLKELHTLSMHVSRYLVRFYGAFYDGAGAVHIALEFMDRGCLSSFVKKFGAIPELVTRSIAMDCLRGLRFLHSHRVLHRDFKTANILLSRSQCCAKVSDFGLARDLNSGVSRADTFVGTVAYMSPERLQGSDYTYASDIWALGVSVVECLLGRYPFNRPQNYFDYIETTMTSNLLDGAEMGSFSEDAKSFIGLCTDTDPKKRPTAVQLLDHAWLKNWTRDKEMFGSWMDDCASKSISMSTKTVANS